MCLFGYISCEWEDNIRCKKEIINTIQVKFNMYVDQIKENTLVAK